MKNLFLSAFVTLVAVDSALAANVSQNDMLVGGGDASANSDTGVEFWKNFLASTQSFLFAVVGITAVVVFVYLGYKLFAAQGNEEEFRKAWKGIVYAVIGLALIPASFAIVKIVTGFDIK